MAVRADESKVYQSSHLPWRQVLKRNTMMTFYGAFPSLAVDLLHRPAASLAPQLVDASLLAAYEASVPLSDPMQPFPDARFVEAQIVGKQQRFSSAKLNGISPYRGGGGL